MNTPGQDRSGGGERAFSLYTTPQLRLVAAIGRLIGELPADIVQTAYDFAQHRLGEPQILPGRAMCTPLLFRGDDENEFGGLEFDYTTADGLLGTHFMGVRVAAYRTEEGRVRATTPFDIDQAEIVARAVEALGAFCETEGISTAPDLTICASNVAEAPFIIEVPSSAL